MFLETGETPQLRVRQPSAPRAAPPAIAAPEIRVVESARETPAQLPPQTPPSSGFTRAKNRIEEESAGPSGPPDFRDAFLSTPDDVPSVPRQSRSPAMPTLEAAKERSLYDRVIDPRRAPPPGPPQPAVVETSAKTRPPSVVPVVVAVVVLLIIVVSVFVVLVIRS